MAETLSRDVALNVIGKIESYQKELEKLPNVTAKAAAKSALAMQNTFTKDLVKQFKEAEKAAARSAGNWREIFGMVSSHIGADLLKSLAGTISGMKGELAALTGEINTYATATGLSAESVNALRFAMVSQGRTFDELGSALENFPERMEQFRQGGGEAAGMMEILGFKSKDANKLIADMGGTFEEVIRRVQGLPNEAQRAAIMTSLFGDSALYLSTALGDVPLEEWKDRAKIGIDVSRDAVAANASWASTTAILGEAFTRTKQDLTGLIDLNGLVKNMGYAFVVMSEVAIGGLDEILQRTSWWVTTLRMLSQGDLKSANEASAQVFDGLGKAMKDVIAEAVVAGDEFYSVASSIGNTSAEAGTLTTKLGKTSSELKDLAAASAKAAAEQKKLRDAAFEMYDMFRDVESKGTDQDKLWDEKIKRERKFLFDVAKENKLSRFEIDRYKKASEEKYYLDSKALRDKDLKETQDTAKEVADLAKDAVKEKTEQIKQYYVDIAELGFEYAEIVSDTLGGIFDLMAQSRAKDLAGARKNVDRQKDLIAGLYDEMDDADSKAELAKLQRRVDARKEDLKGAREQVKVAKEAAKEVAAMQKAQGIFSIGLSTAQAVMMAWATVPPPLQIPAAVAAAVAGAAQMAIAAATPLPTFFGGTGRVPGGMPGEMQVTAHEGEALLNARAVDRLGAGMIDALNAGLSPLAAFAGGGGGGGDVYLDGRLVGSVMDKSRRRNARKPTGYSSPFGRR